MKQSPMPAVITILNKAAMKLLPSTWYHSLTFYLLEKATGLFTNVPGPREAVSVAGEGIDDIMFYVPALCSTTFSILSYNGYINFGVMANKGGGLNIKPEELTQIFTEQFYEIHGAVTAAAAPAAAPSDCKDDIDGNKATAPLSSSSSVSSLNKSEEQKNKERRAALHLLREKLIQKGEELKSPWSSYIISFIVFVFILIRFRVFFKLYLIAVTYAYMTLFYRQLSSILDRGFIQIPIFIP
mmetsp:Transcript_11690/g.16174  ORF Transcript_11690/g.16174 Transcript_11690/m.16174 type:complete len:241 (-) Transcript_11690:174-896(-)